MLSITPRQLLHALTANHHDVAKKQNANNLQFHSAGFDCECDNVVATSPFTEEFEKFNQPQSTSFRTFIEIFSSPDLAKAVIYVELRGPPSA